MRLVEKHHIKENHKYFKECDELSFKSKNLYNFANYIVRQEFINNKKYIGVFEIQKMIQTTFDYKNLPAKVSQQTLRLLDKNWKSFFKSIKDWKKHPYKYEGRPKLPKYKHKTKGRSVVIYDAQAISKTFLKQGKIKLSQTNIIIDYQHKGCKVKQARIVPRLDFYVIEIVYEKEIKDKKLNKENVIGIDLGVNNLCSIASNKINPVIINGKPLKSINQYYNKKKARLQSILNKGGSDVTVRSSKAIRKLSNKRNNKVNDYLHKTSKKIIDLCLTKDVGTIIIGKNKNWKTNINIRKRNNQTFVDIPFAKLIDMIKYKAELIRIDVSLTEESYTSKCSFLDNEDLKKQKVYLGKRIKRGLFKSEKGILINADINGAFNIIRKVISNFTIGENEIQDFAVSPRLLKI